MTVPTTAKQQSSRKQGESAKRRGAGWSHTEKYVYDPGTPLNLRILPTDLPGLQASELRSYSGLCFSVKMSGYACQDDRDSQCTTEIFDEYIKGETKGGLSGKQFCFLGCEPHSDRYRTSQTCNT